MIIVLIIDLRRPGISPTILVEIGLGSVPARSRAGRSRLAAFPCRDPGRQMTNEPPADPSITRPAPAVASERSPSGGPEGASEAVPAGSGSINLTLPKIIPFQTLARCGEEIWIENEGQIYRLRRTRQGKLILTK